jgi:dihydrofolate reductase
MRKLFAFNMVTLDGFFEGPGHDISWHNVDAEFNAFAEQQLGTLDALMFGRVTYELMAAWWPTEMGKAEAPVIAAAMNRLPKFVISSTLANADWNNTKIISENIAGEVAALKQQPGKDIALFGSARTLATLMALDMIDEHRIIVSPVVIGAGTPLFQDVKQKQDMALVSTRVFSSGNVLLCYQPRRTVAP